MPKVTYEIVQHDGGWAYKVKEIAPRVVRVAFLFNPETAPFAEFYLNPFKAAAPSLAVEAIAAPVHDAFLLESVIAAQAGEPSGGLIVMPETFLNVHRAEVTSPCGRAAEQHDERGPFHQQFLPCFEAQDSTAAGHRLAPLAISASCHERL